MAEGGSDTTSRTRRQRAPAPLPAITYALLLIMALVFAAMWRAGHGDVTRVAYLFGDKEKDLILAGQYWRLVTAIFLHGSPVHLFVNSLSLYWLGSQMEIIYGSRKYLLIFLAAGVAGNLLSLMLSPAPSLGASGAIFGLVGAGLIFPMRYRALVPAQTRSQILSQLLLVTIVNLGIGYADRNIDNMAHIGGLLGGGFMALFLIPDVLESGPRSRAADAALSAAVTAALLVVVWAAFSQWRWAVQNPDVPLETSFYAPPAVETPSPPSPLLQTFGPSTVRDLNFAILKGRGGTVNAVFSISPPQFLGIAGGGLEPLRERPMPWEQGVGASFSLYPTPYTLNPAPGVRAKVRNTV